MFFNETATTEIYTLSLPDALPICQRHEQADDVRPPAPAAGQEGALQHEAEGVARRGLPGGHDGLILRASQVSKHSKPIDRKSTRLNSSHANISYAVFCLTKKTQTK